MSPDPPRDNRAVPPQRRGKAGDIGSLARVPNGPTDVTVLDEARPVTSDNEIASSSEASEPANVLTEKSPNETGRKTKSSRSRKKSWTHLSIVASPTWVFEVTVSTNQASSQQVYQWSVMIMVKEGLKNRPVLVLKLLEDEKYRVFEFFTFDMKGPFRKTAHNYLAADGRDYDPAITPPVNLICFVDVEGNPTSLHKRSWLKCVEPRALKKHELREPDGGSILVRPKDRKMINTMINDCHLPGT
ncbi:hypothetical protein C8034_v000359 [Colletotrichum sidae]|uniref:Uncharacterized protein n=1 Tax=Colletotrichum sidae TaxID=1347389 RepID=A0A4R8TG47_9PEZI|nr:hypothetical protein C8034_v000359 [Colletotrichum sidae]